jgi:glycosyltransferase involved in cell wall biosynthesis
MRKIAFIATNEWVPWGGSELLWSRAAERLVRRGVEVCISVKEWKSPVKQIGDLQSIGCRIFYRPFPPSLSERVKRNLLGDRYHLPHIRTVGRDADLIVISQGANFDGMAWMESARSLGLRYAVISQSAADHLWPPDEMGERLAGCYEGARAAYFVSEANLALTRKQLAAAVSRGKVIRNPFNVRYDARPAWPGDPAEALRLGCVARLEPVQKSQDILIEVLDRSKWRGRNVRVTLAGGGENERTLRRLVRSMGLPNVEFAGFVDDIEEFWTRHHALVLPSRYEGMPLSLVEAMICGRAGIVTDVGGNAELVRAGVNGFVAKAPTADFVDDAIERAWENRRRLREMGETAAADVRKWVSADPVADFVRELECAVNGHAPAENA